MLIAMKLSRIIEALESLAPQHLAESWDQVGLHVGNPEQRVSRAMLCIDLTESVLDEAITQQIQLIVAYHPPIFKPLARLTTTDLKQRIIHTAARKGIAIYSPHTALDAAKGGVNDWLAYGLGAGSVRVIKPCDCTAKRFKLVTFVPFEALDAVRTAICNAGAGRIGEYELCSYASDGTGTFKGGNATSPTIGQAGRFERVEEARLEVPVPANRLADVLSALRTAHPYEEPAFDVYPLESVSDTQTGQGRVVTLDKPVSLTSLTKRIKDHLGVKHLEVTAGMGQSSIQRIGLCAGAGGSLMSDAGPIDAFFTGEMRHHDALEAAGRGVAVILAGHTQTERPYLPTFRGNLKKLTGSAVTWQISRQDKPPTEVK